MKQVEFARCIVFSALLVVVLSGCAANMATPIAVDSLAASPDGAPPRFDAAETSRPANPSAAARNEAPGLVVHIDPTTGEFLPEPAADGVTTQAADTAKAPVRQLKAVPSPTLGGGIMIDLQGQFQTPLIVTIDADGKLTMKHEPMAPAGTENK